MSAYLLDSSALLAHWRREPGAERVQAILEERDAELLVAAPSIAELARRAVALGLAADETRSLSLEYAGLADQVLPSDAAVAVRAFELGQACASRLPLIDALIAASASLRGARLVHRDPHFDELPRELLAAERLG